MLEIGELQPYLGPYDPAALSYSWTAADERTVDLQRDLNAIVEAGSQRPNAEVFCDIYERVLSAAGRTNGSRDAILASVVEGPRLTEPWFCCAEPTKDQFSSFVGKD